MAAWQAAYRHRTSRNGDPSSTPTPGSQRNQSRRPLDHLYHPAIYDHATTPSYIYEAHLRDELTRRLGVHS